MGDRDRPGNRKKARLNDELLVFIDESSFGMQSTVVRTWGPRGKTPVHVGSGKWERWKVLAVLAVAPASGATVFSHWMSPEGIPGRVIAEFLRDFLEYYNKPAVVCWDNDSSHKYAQRLLTTPEFDTATRVAVSFPKMPAYAPELMPVEQVWKYGKIDLLGNFVPFDFTDLKWEVDRSIASIGDRPDLLRSFVRWAGFELDESLWQ